jgi:ubiquinone/menaquinone biosynthesis C-methylase UbiE
MDEELGFKRVWDKRARTKSVEEVVFGPFLVRKYSMEIDVRIFGFVEDLLHASVGNLILDVGCGPLARAELYFAQQGYEIVGVDVSAAGLLKARENVADHTVKHVHFVLADAESLPFREGSFDRVLAVGLLSHLPNKYSVVTSLRDIHRCLKENGICYLNWFPNLYSFFGAFIALANKIAYSGKKERVQVLAFRGLKEIRCLLQHAGLKISKTIYGSVIMFVYYPSPKIVKRGIEKLFSVADEFRRRHPTRAFLPYSFDVLARKG